MKKMLLAGAALAMIAGSASAQSTWQGQTYGDGNVSFGLNATVAEFCKFNQAGGTVAFQENGSFAQGSVAGVGGSSAVQGDGNVTMNIQNTDDNTIRKAVVVLNYEKTVCNTPFQVTTQSLNGGLKSANTTTDTDYQTLVPYTVGTYIGGERRSFLSSAALTSVTQTASENQAWAGQFAVSFETAATDKLLVQGTYTDTVYVRMTPTVSGGTSTR